MVGQPDAAVGMEHAIDRMYGIGLIVRLAYGRIGIEICEALGQGRTEQPAGKFATHVEVAQAPCVAPPPSRNEARCSQRS